MGISPTMPQQCLTPLKGHSAIGDCFCIGIGMTRPEPRGGSDTIRVKNKAQILKNQKGDYLISRIAVSAFSFCTLSIIDFWKRSKFSSHIFYPGALPTELPDYVRVGLEPTTTRSYFLELLYATFQFLDVKCDFQLLPSLYPV